MGNLEGLKESQNSAETRRTLAKFDDDDLTPLTWLQDDLLRNFTPPRFNASEVTITNENLSPGVNGKEHSSLAAASLVQGQRATSLTRTVPAVTYNPQIHVHAKPPYSFSSLIGMAIESSPSRALAVKDIYSWIIEQFPYYQSAPNGWKNTVRHNLSLNKCFRKVDKDDVTPLAGKGSLWTVDPNLRTNLLQAIKRTPAHVYPYMSATTPTKDNFCGVVPIADVFIQGKKSLTLEQVQSSINSAQPVSFPVLSKRLLVPYSKISSRESKEADAAESMLTLTQYGSPSTVTQTNKKCHQLETFVNGTTAPVTTVTTCPPNDHNYYSTDKGEHLENGRELIIPDVSEEEVSGTSSLGSSDDHEDDDEGRDSGKILKPVAIKTEPCTDEEGVKGAEALLNLASRSKRRLSQQSSLNIKKSKASSD